MTMPATDPIWALTEKEKQTLRLIVRGHDAKSIARCLDLSVHTINERLREARRKMAVSSSREAARMLLAAEGGSAGASTPENVGDTVLGDDTRPARVDHVVTPIGGVGWLMRHPRITIGGLLMSLILGLLAITALPGGVVAPAAAPMAAAAEAPNPAVVDAARRFLALIDQGKWEESYRATGATFQHLNTLQAWTSASEQARAPLGAVLSRTFLSQENLPAPPAGYEVVKFRTSFANKPDAIETVTLDGQSGDWYVVGVIIE